MGKREIKLGETYLLENGKTFIPVKYEKGVKIIQNGRETVARKEGRYIDSEGKRLRKRFLTKAELLSHGKEV